MDTEDARAVLAALGLADEMAEAVRYYFKIQESAPAKPEIDYYKVRAKAKDLLRIAVEKYLENKRCTVAYYC
jgi:CYTH domain-containing protein